MKTLFIGFLVIGLSVAAICQGETYMISQETPPSLTIVGASTLHDWTVTVKDWGGYPEKISFDNSDSRTISGFSFSANTKSMDGGRGSTMNNKIYTALKAEEYPTISFEQNGDVVLTSEDGNTYTGDVTGILDMMGEKSQINVSIISNISDGILTIKADKPMKLSDYNITPPTAMFGQIKTKDDITVKFECIYKLSS